MHEERVGFEDLSAEPMEVRLVGEVTTCRDCDWFWRPAPYGPYPAFDWTEDYPVALRERTSRQHRDGEMVRQLDGRLGGQALVDPQLLHGCRKAPLMSIGINPNLTAFWPGTDGARWAYPRFARFRRYAYYYRHRTVHQESLPLEAVRPHVRPEGALVAKKPGRVQEVMRSMRERELTVTLAYEDGEEETVARTWDLDDHFVLLFDRATDDAPQFGAGDVVGGALNLPAGDELAVEQNVVGYYQRVIPILELVSAYLRSQGEIPDLQMAEDFCQLDMVACASPGWGKVYGIDKQQVVDNCVHANAWVVRQLLQSEPRVIVFSGRSAFSMFYRIFRPFLSTRVPEEMDVYGLLKWTARDPHYLDIRTDVDGREYHLRARILIAPHFSYDDNFLPHARLSREEWEQFGADFPEARELLLAQEERVTEPNRDGYRGVRLDGLGAFKDDHPRAVIQLMRKVYDASALIGEGIAQEILLGNVGFDRADRHLARAAGPCRFCVNDQWEFPEGCAYGKPDEEPHPEGFLDRVVEYVTGRLVAAADADIP